ncbi:MAG: hypothetical protein N4A61_00200 [Pelagimonas sp.]|nr:hypothetical protein [Pelagimonas sp.]
MKLIETIYRAALDPRGYDNFMGEWDDWLATRLQELQHLKETDPGLSAPGVVAHFDLATRLLEKIGEPTQSLQAASGPQVLLDRTGQILWQNAEADTLLGRGKFRTLRDLHLSDHHRALVQDFLAGHPMAVGRPAVVQIKDSTGQRALSFQLKEMQEGPETDLVLLSPLGPAWPDAADQLLMDSHGLTPSECEICALLSQGRNPAEISEHRGSAVATVRTQIKKILAKTGTSGQSELIVHLHAIIRLAETIETPLPARLDSPQSGGQWVDVSLSDRVMPVECFGPEDGRPVIFVHGMLDGLEIVTHIEPLLHQHGLRFICPHRPHFGTATGAGGPSADAPAHFARDMQELTDTWGIRHPVIVGHMAGALYAFAAAPAIQARAIVNVAGGVPITSVSQFDSMTRRQRLVAYTARFTPSVLPFVLRAGIRQIRNGGAAAFMAALYEHAPVDNAVVQDPAVRDLILSGHDFTVVQGHMAFSIDSYHVVRDWSDLVTQSAPIPVHLVHGHHDPVVSVSSVQGFADRHANRVQLDLLEDAGQLVFYQHAERIVSRLKQLFD